MTRRQLRNGWLAVTLVGWWAVVGGAQAQPEGDDVRTRLAGRVMDVQGLALPGATIALRRVDGTLVTTTVTGRDGDFVLGLTAPGEYLVVASLQGFREAAQTVRLGEVPVDLEVTLDIGGFEQEVTVAAVMPEVAGELIVTGREIERRMPRDLAASLRQESGVNAVRRGAINLEPTIRGLFEAQIGMFVDGTRTFAAGPARMDSEISHVSPHMMQAVRVVKGPYALAWGAGALSAIQVETFKPAFSGGRFVLNGQAGFTHGTNGNANDGYAGLYGRSDRIRFTFLHNARGGDDYTDGDGRNVPGDYASRETRWDVGVRPVPELLVEYSGGVQTQDDVSYPGRLLDAEFIETRSHAVDVAFRPTTGALREVLGQIYRNDKDHAMTNDDKPTARDMPGRMPPFGLDVGVDTRSDTLGGRAHVSLDAAAVTVKAGFDVYRLEQDADRTIAQRSTGGILFEDIVWPDATIVNSGGYAQLVYDRDGVRVGGTLRVDHERSEAGTVSPFFRANTSGPLDHEDTSVSGAVNGALRLSDVWQLTLGVGRAVRQPTVLERYSDRFPSTKFQIAAEFMGQPDLRPERSLEVNVGSVLQVYRGSLQADFFYRRIDGYITVEADPDLPRRLPLSPPTVYRYLNGDEARFVGYDVRAETAVGAWIDVWGGWTYVWAEDTRFGEPLFGISPFEQRYSVELHTVDRQAWVELLVTSAARQDRVATVRRERPTPGWTTLDLLAGFELSDGLTIQAGLENATDAAYATHVNSLNPFTGERIAEIGRNLYVGAGYEF